MHYQWQKQLQKRHVATLNSAHQAKKQVNFDSGWLELWQVTSEQSWKKVFSRTANKTIPLLQPEHGFCQQDGAECGQVQDWYPNEKMVVVPVCLNGSNVRQGVWVLYRVDKDEGDESLPFPAFRRDAVNSTFLKYSKEDRLSSSQVGIRNILADVCCNETKHYKVKSEHRHIQNPFKRLR